MGLWLSSRNRTKTICSPLPPRQEDRWSSSEERGRTETTRLRCLKWRRGRAAWSGVEGPNPCKGRNRRVSEPGIKRRAQSLCPGNGIKRAVDPSVLFGKAGSFHLGPGNWLDTSLPGTALILPLGKELMLSSTSLPCQSPIIQYSVASLLTQKGPHHTQNLLLSHQLQFGYKLHRDRISLAQQIPGSF